MRAIEQIPRPAPAERDRTLADLLLAAGDRPGGTALRVRRSGAAESWTYPEFGAAVHEIARGLMALGVAPGDRVAILGATRPEWTMTDAAVLATGAVVVPVYQTNSPEECRFVLAHSEASVVICEDAGQLAKVQAVAEQLPALRHEITMVDVAGAPSLADLRAHAVDVAPEALEQRRAAIAPGDIATIVYTSGTTGPPKGCALTHDNCTATIAMYEQRLALSSEHSVFLFLPLAHVLARMTQMVMLDIGGTVEYWSGDPSRLLDDLAAAQPTHLPTVPRVFEKIHTRALATVADTGGPREQLFDAAFAIGRRVHAAERSGSVKPALRLAQLVADQLVLGKVRDLFGGRLVLALTGAAPIARDVLEFFDACGVRILDGYGLTESCAAATLNTEDAFRLGTVGRPLPGVEVRVAEDGEVQLRGPNVFPGYVGDEEATAAALEDGWLLTGDLGELDRDGFLRITGRKKDLIITSSGKNVTPSNVEAALRESRWISQAVVYGDRHPYLVALLTLDPEEVPALAQHTGVQPVVDTMAGDPRVLAVIKREVDAVNEHFARIEQVKRFAILDHDLTQGAGELTPTLKVKRPVVYERYLDRFELLYA
jgi:long-chain acyl-CoA synthetase